MQQWQQLIEKRQKTVPPQRLMCRCYAPANGPMLPSWQHPGQRYLNIVPIGQSVSNTNCCASENKEYAQSQYTWPELERLDQGRRTVLHQKRGLTWILCECFATAQAQNGDEAIATMAGMKVKISSWKCSVKSNFSPYCGPKDRSAAMSWGAIALPECSPHRRHRVLPVSVGG